MTSSKNATFYHLQWNLQKRLMKMLIWLKECDMAKVKYFTLKLRYHFLNIIFYFFYQSNIDNATFRERFSA